MRTKGDTYIGRKSEAKMDVTSGAKYTGDGDVYVGKYSTADATLNLSNGGEFEAKSNFIVGADAGSVGKVNITNFTTKITTKKTTYIGQNGNGSMNITNGGTYKAIGNTSSGYGNVFIGTGFRLNKLTHHTRPRLTIPKL